jgi:spore coat polysaccharide biosynthesis protein SpsF
VRRVAVVQARMTSTRLPGKVLMPLAGRPMLAQQLRRLQRCERIDEIVVATTVNATDDVVMQVAAAAGVRWFRGSEVDVLGRYAGAARETSADVIVRLTADCPLIDPGVTDRVIDALTACPERADYASNVLRRTFPVGLDCEALWSDTLFRVERLARTPSAREHVTTFVYRERADLFMLESVADTEDNSDLRWTVDVEADLATVRELYEALGLGDRAVDYREIVRYARAHPARRDARAAAAVRPGVS